VHKVIEMLKTENGNIYLFTVGLSQMRYLKTKKYNNGKFIVCHRSGSYNYLGH